jgi:hypothetical protein
LKDKIDMALPDDFQEEFRRAVAALAKAHQDIEAVGLANQTTEHESRVLEARRKIAVLLQRMIDRHNLRPFVTFRGKIYALASEPTPLNLIIIEEDKIQEIK